uniref:Uncharacterized protein n=1 Tax=Anas platyrhynchos platyrhynchos TaxID=8840 RepID=A0A493SZX7_ANAPP
MSHVLPSLEEVAGLYRELSQHPGLSTACLGPDVTTQYGGKYSPELDRSTDEDLERPEKPDAPLKVGPRHPRGDGFAPRGWH